MKSLKAISLQNPKCLGPIMCDVAYHVHAKLWDERLFVLYTLQLRILR